jgi:drug/metabolite transporter (DMT)-like permease
MWFGTTPLSQSAFFNSLAVIVVPMLDAVLLGKAMGSRSMASVALAMVGVGLLEVGVGPVSSSLLSPLPQLVDEEQLMNQAVTALATIANFVTAGDLYCLGQALFFGIGYWRLGAASLAYPNESSSRLLTAGQLAAVAVGSVLYWVVADGPVSTETVSQLVTVIWHNPFIWKALVWTGLFSTALAIYLETVALTIVSATELTVLMTSISLWGSAFSYILTGEVLPAIGMVGGLLILAGCVLLATEPSSDDDTRETL